jgi:hypothetical protein
MKIQNIHTTDLRPIFVQNHELGRSNIEEYLRTMGNFNSEYTLNSLVKNGLLERTGRGKYILGLKRQLYTPPLENEIKGIYGLIQEEKPLLECCVWRTSIINEFTLHQAGRFAQMVEIERDGLEPVFDLLRDHYPNVYQNDAIVIIPLTSESPTQRIEGVRTTTIEKLLVDLISDVKLYESFQGAELAYIIKEAFRKYPINKDKMLRYARRRRKGNNVESMIEMSLQLEDF